MISQRRFKAIDDYPSKFDWPGIKGLMKIKNRRGPSTVPCEMPDVKHCVFELLPLTRTHCCLFVRKDENQRKVFPENPKSDNLNNNVGQE